MNVMVPRDKTACQTFPCKCKICISSLESDVYNKKKIQTFVVNMTYFNVNMTYCREYALFQHSTSREVKKCIFHSCLRHSRNIHFFTSLDEIKSYSLQTFEYPPCISLLLVFIQLSDCPNNQQPSAVYR